MKFCYGLSVGAPGGMGGGQVVVNTGGGSNSGGGTTTPSNITEVLAGGLNYRSDGPRDAWGKRA